MNRVYKVIYNRARNLYQVVSEIVHSRGKTKSLTAQHRHDRLTTSILIALFAMGTSLPVGWAAGTTTTATDPTTVEDAKVDASNLSGENKTAWRTALGGGKVAADDVKLIAGQDIYKELRPIAATSERLTYVSPDNSTADNLKNLDIQLGTNTTAISTLNTTIGTITSGTTVAGNLSKLDTQVKNNAAGLSALSNTVSTNNTNLNTKITFITSDITSLKDLSNITDAGRKVITGLSTIITQGDRVTITSTSDATTGQTTYTISANNDGTIISGDTNLVSGGTMYKELRPASGQYIRADQSTAKNLISLDQNLLNVVNALGLDADDTSKSYTSKLNKYFKVNPEITTNNDNTKTYAADAAANGTNSVAIGPSAQAGEKTKDATTSATTVTGGTSSTAIGDRAKANGDQSVALGYNSQVLNASGSTTAISCSTAIGNGAKVEGGSDSTALGTGATVDTASNAMAFGKGATINKTATSGVAIGNGAVTGSEDTTKTVDNVTYNIKAAGGVDSVAIGTNASSAGNTSIALGKGAAIENDTDGNYQAVVKSDDVAIGTGAKTSASDSSTAIGKSATVSQSTDAMAIGSSATVGASSNNAMALGKGAAVSSGAADSIAMGTSAKTVSADTIAIGQDTSATGANSVVIGKGATTTVEGGNAIGLSSTASGSSTAIGQSATANNYNAVAIGNKATANADKSISLGYEAGVDTSEGKGETQNAGSLIAIGTSSGNNVSGMQNVAIGEGAGSNVKSSYNIAIGTQAGYGINYASDDKSQNGYNVSIGYNANYQKNSANIMYSTALGNEANASNYAVAIGDKAKASGTYSLALGDTAQANDTESIAFGHNASASDGNIAIGNGSSAPAVSTLGTVKAVTVDGTTVNYVYDANGNQFKSAFTYKPLQADSHYISVGNSTLTRRISNVADGVFDSDAATVGQLNSLNELLQATDTKVGLTKDYFEQKFTDLNTTIDSSKTHYFSISESSDNLSGNKDNTGATSNKADAMAIGPNANATNVKSLAVGNNVYATGLRSIAIGTAPNPTTDAAGKTTTHNTSAEGENSIALGTSTTAQADNSVAIGTRAQTYTTDTKSGKTGARSVAIGNLATTAGDESVALGYSATVKYNYGTAIGKEALSSGVDAVAIGKGSKAYSTDSMAIGQDNTVIGNNVYGLGSSNSFSGEWESIIQSGVSGYKNTITSVSDQDTTNALTGIYLTGNSNTLNQNVKYNVMQDITVQGSSNTIDGGAGGTSSHQNTLSQIAIVGSGNTVQGKSSDDGKTNNIKDVTILGYNNTVDANKDTTVDFSNTQILGSNVTATLGNSVYLGNHAAYVQPNGPAQDAIDAARTKADTAAEASDEYKAAATDEDKATIKAQYEAKYLYKLRVQAMEAKGTTAGMNSYNTDETYGNGTSYTYAGSNPTGAITVGSAGAERRIQNVAAGLVSATSTDAVNGSQLYALTRQIRFGGDNSTFGKTTAADDQNVVARGSNETISITGGSDAVTASTTDGTTTYTVDAAKLTGNNIAVIADKDANALHVQLASNLKDLNTAQLGSGNGESYKETIKLDGTGTSGGQMTLASADGTVKTTLDTTGITIANGPKFTSSGIDAANQQIHNVTAGTKDADAVNVKQLQSARTLLTQGTNTTLADTDADGHHTYTVNVDNLAVKANGTGTTVALANGINFKNGTNTTSSVDANGNVTIDTKNLALKANGTNTATVTMDNGINFKNGTNTTATVGTDGTVTINATHNKLSTVSAATGDNDNVTLTLTDADGNTVTSTGLKNTYTTVTKNGTAHTVTFARNDGTTQTLSLGDLDGASTEALNKAAAKATSEVTNGTNVASVTKTAGTNGQNIYTVNVDDLAVKTTSGEKKSVHLADGLVFADGTNTTATVGDNGTIKFNVSDAAIKKQAVQAVNVTGDNKNVTVTPETNADGTLKTFTVTATHNKLNATGAATKATADSNAVTLTLQDADGNTTTTGLTDTYTTVSKDATTKKVTFKRNDSETQTLDLSDLGGITAAQDKYITGGTVSYDTNGNGTASLTGTNGLTASIRGLKDTKVSSGTASYMDAQGNATMNGSAVLTMNDGSTATISGLKDDYITSAAVGAENNHVTMTRLGGGTVDLNLNPILEKYSLSDYHLVGAGTTHDQAYAVDSNGTVTLNVVDDKNPTGTPKTIQITGLASQSGVSAGRTTVTSSDQSVTINDSSPNSDTHTYDIKVDYSKIPANLKVQYRGDNDTAGSNTMNTATAFTGTANQIVTTAANGKVSFKLADDISGIKSVTTGNSKLNTDGLTVTNGPTFTKSNIDVNNQQIHKVTAGESDTDAANVGQVKAATTEVQAGTNVSVGKPATDSTDNHKIYTVNVDNLSLSQNGTKVGTGVALKDGLDFQNGTNTTASVTADGKVSFSISNDAIKAQAKDAVVLAAGDNVTIGTPTDANNVKTYTVSVNDLKLQADGADKATRKLSDGINFAGGTNTMADVTADGKVTYDLKDSISLNQVQTGESKLNTNGLTITGGPKVLKSGIDAGNKQITNVASGGTVESNAATIGDLKKAIETASAGTTASGFKTKGNYGEAVTSRLDKQLNIVGDVDTTKVAKDNLSNDNVGVVTSTDTNGNATLTVKLNKDINLGENGSVTTGSTLMNKTGITNGNMSLGADGLTIQNGPKFTNNGINAANQKITGVANGTNPNDAVNVSQLEAVKSDVTTGWTIAGKNASGTDLTANIGKGKTVSYAGGKYATATLSVDSTTGNATVAVDAVTNTLSVGADGKITSNGDGLTTTGAVKDAINGAYWTIQAGNATGSAQKVSAGSTITFNAGSNLSLSQDGTNFTYALNTDLQNMTSVTAKDQKDNTAVLTGEGLKVSDKDGNSLTQHATEIRLHDATKTATGTTTDVVLNKQGLQNGGHTITGVANGTVDAGSQDAINGSLLYELQQKVTNATNTGATVSYTAQTASLTTTDGKAALTGTTDGLVTGTNLTSVLNSLSWTAQSSQVGSGQNNGSTLQSITAGSKVGFIAGNNMILTQDGTNFTYALNSSLTGMNTIAFTGLGSGASNLTIGLQNGGGANPDKGYYITGLSNTKWDQSNYEGTRAATEAQLREAIDKVSAATGTGGFGLTADEGANNGGEKKVSQTLGRTIAIQGDGTYGADGTVVKQGNISTVAYTDNAGPTGAIKVKLNKDIDLSEAGSLTIGASKVSAGSIVLDNTGDAAKKIALNSTAGTASIGGVTVNGTAKTIMGLANTTWDGTAVSGRAATEDQLAKAISDASTQASNSELHIRKGTYGVGKDKDGQYLADPKGKNSVSIDVVNAKGAVDGQVVINDVAKASELGTVGELADNLKNPNGGPTTVVQAVNKVNQKVDDSLKQVNGDVTNAVTEAKKHTKVQSVDSDNNVTIDGTTTNADGGTVYKLGLNKQHMNLDKVHIYGTEGKVTAKDVEAETVKTGNTTVADGRVVVGGDNGIKIEANDGQQTILGLSNRTWNGRAVSGRAATEDQLQQAVENATATAAQNEQHIQAGNYNVGLGKGLDGKAIDKNSVAINVVSGDGTKPGDVKGQVVINNVAKADELGDVAKLNDTVKNADGRPTSTVDAINNLDKRVETTVGDNVYSGVKGKEIADGDSATTAIGKLNNRMNDIYTTAGQHSSVSTADTNLTLSESKNTSGGTDYKIGLNKDQINLGNLTIKGNEGSIEANSIKSDSFTAGDTVVNKDGIKVGDQSALTGDSLKVNGKTYVDDKGVNANGQVIRNVGDGKDDGDAVNVKQVNDLAARQGEVIGQNAAHINQLDRAVNRLDSRINRVGAGAAALAALHPGNYDPDDKVDFVAGFGNYRGASAAAVGMYYHPDETTTMSVGASFGGGENMVNAGITWKMGKDSGHMRTQAATKAVPVQFVAAPTQTTQPTGQTEGTKTPQPVTAVTTTASGQQVPIVAAYLPSVDNSTRAENDELKELLARQTAILEKLAEQKTAAAPAAAAAPVSGEDLFPDVPENHWAYDFVAKAGALKDCRVEAPANNPMLTRNDFAQILYTALKNGATKNPALNKDNGLNRLASEFRVELKNVKR